VSNLRNLVLVFVTVAAVLSSERALAQRGANTVNSKPPPVVQVDVTMAACMAVSDVDDSDNSEVKRFDTPRLIGGISYNRVISSTIAEELYLNYSVDSNGVGLYNRLYVTQQKRHINIRSYKVASWASHAPNDASGFMTPLEFAFITTENLDEAPSKNAIWFHLSMPDTRSAISRSTANIYTEYRSIKCFNEEKR
jgi:hypothetical protein